MLRFAVITFGCKLNQAESSHLQKQLIQRGWVVAKEQAADYYLINACAVTAKAEKELRQKINQLKRQHPKGFLVVTGCFLPQNNDGVDLWLKKDKLVKQLVRLGRGLKKSERKEFGLLETRRTRAMIKIQDGCDNYCAYCIVPYLRGKSKNRSSRSIIQKIRQGERVGIKEVVLVGTDLKKYQDAKNKIWSLGDLLKKILKETVIPRIRISSLWPTAISGDLIALIKKEPRLCRHLHLSIQSGSDNILKKMGRNYRTREVVRIINRLKNIPRLDLTADFIVGFPGETKQDFDATVRLVKSAGFLKVHTFRYSARPKTVAAKLPDQIDEKAKKTRSQQLIRIAARTANGVKNKYLSQIFPVLFENMNGKLWSGLTPNYLRIFAQSKKDLTNQIINVKLLRLLKDGIYGKIDNT